ncbi:MAG TPA: HAD-IC family P-type ATPase [Caulobacteraceae bacterium]|nr:HAD-IC family P-type ATPase [Caulobacteraceae bacterium]
MNDMIPASTSTSAASSAIGAGLSSAEAARRLAEFGPNAAPEEPEHPVKRILRHFWSPVPWMLEATVVLQLLIGERVEALMIVVLLLLNVALGVFQETRANATLQLLKQRLAPRAKVRRDGVWVDRPAADIVTGDIVQLSLGGIVPADLRVLDGAVLLDQSMLTGESIAVDVGPGKTAYAGALVRRGEATGEVAATGVHTFFGRTAELVRIAQVESSEQKAVMGVVRTLTVINFAIVVGMVGYARFIGMNAPQIIPLVLTALLSAVPIALPATFTLAAALGARRLALKGVLLTRLTALQEAAMIDVLCVDKTGTLTENLLTVGGVQPLVGGYGKGDVLAFAAAASSPDGQDPVDVAVRKAAGESGDTLRAPLRVSRFIPFDPAAKLAEAWATDGSGGEVRVVKGAPAAIAAIAAMTPQAEEATERFAASGYRALAVAAGPPTALSVIGVIGLSDPPRRDSAGLLAELRSLGVRAVMVTGDSPITAATVARAIGLEGKICPPGHIPDTAEPDDFAVYAGVFPEDKFRLVKAFQRHGHGVGMCGDGANDSPALRQAQMGIAVSTATDVAKSAAGVVLTEPGLSGIVSCIKEGRSSFQRVLTYTLSILINKCAALIVMGAGLVMTGHAVLTPFLQALSMLAGDMVMMSRTADHAKPTAYPNHWRIRNLTAAAIPLGLFKLLFCLSILAVGWFQFRLSAGQMQTLTFLTLILAGQANTYAMRERGRLWNSRPAGVMILASLADITLVTSLAVAGLMMAPLPAALAAGLFVTTGVFALCLDTIKVGVFSHVRID